jgi:hypothetical protein
MLSIPRYIRNQDTQDFRANLKDAVAGASTTVVGKSKKKSKELKLEIDTSILKSYEMIDIPIRMDFRWIYIMNDPS